MHCIILQVNYLCWKVWIQLYLLETNTEGSIHSGIINGILVEIDGIIKRYTNQYPDIKVIVTGGNAKFFDKGLKNTIFANPNLLMEGLNKILDYNESYF